MLKGQVRCNLGDFEHIIAHVTEDVEGRLEGVADAVLQHAQQTAVFEDKTGKLRKSIKKYKSKFDDGGWIVGSWAPHAHLIEFGHDIIRKGKLVGRVEARPFITPATEAGLRYAYRLTQIGGGSEWYGASGHGFYWRG